MNADIRINISFRGHRKRKKLKALLGYDATGNLLDLWIGAAIARPDGVLVGWDRTDIGIESGMDSATDSEINRYIEALISVGFLEQNDDGTYLLHDWIDHNPYASSSNERSEKAIFSNLKRWHPEEARKLEDKGITAISRSEYREIVDGKSAGVGAESVPDPKPNPPSPSPSQLETENPLFPSGEVKPPPASEEKDSAAKKNPSCPIKKIVELWGKHCPHLPQPDPDGKTIRKQIQARWRESKTRQDLAWWEAYFERIAASDFLSGRIQGKDFRADLIWVSGPKNMEAILGGRYDKNPSASPAAFGPTSQGPQTRGQLLEAAKSRYDRSQQKIVDFDDSDEFADEPRRVGKDV